MKRRTLATRVSQVQLVLTLLALAAVSAGTPFAVHVLLEQKTDDVLLQTIRRVSQLAAQQPEGQLNSQWMQGEISEVRPSDVRVELLDREGRTLVASGPGPRFVVGAPGCYERSVFRVCARRAGASTLIASVDDSADLAAQRRVLGSLLAVAATIGALVVLVSRRVSRRALAPLTELGARISAIEPGTDVRLGTASEFEELENLRSRFDELITRYDDALRRERRLTAQASHELRTPLGVARAEVEALSDPEDLPRQRARALAAMDRLSELIETLLWFARAQVVLDDPRMEIVNLADVVRGQLAERARVNSMIAIRCVLPDEALVRGDETLLGRVTANLLDNAIKYGDGQHIEVLGEWNGDSVQLCVSNSGQPPAKELTERLFEPFFRNASSSSTTPGFGLGLPFARAVARAHGGEVELRPSTADTTRFVLTLPLVEWSEHSDRHAEQQNALPPANG